MTDYRFRGVQARAGVAAVAALVLIAFLSCGLTLTRVAYAHDGPISVRLDHGAKGSFRWTVLAKREPTGNPRRPCIVVVSQAPTAGADEAEGCGPLEPVPMLLAQSSGSGKSERTVLAMAFPLRVVSVRLWLRGRRSRRIYLRRLGAHQAEMTGLRRFRYANRAFAGPYCLARFATYGVAGRLIDRSPSMDCHAT